MGQVNRILRRGVNCYFHYCPGCNELHPLPDKWNFNGNLDCPSFTPSFRHEGKFGICHYILTDGILNFCNDCSHSLANKSITIPDLPEGYTD